MKMKIGTNYEFSWKKVNHFVLNPKNQIPDYVNELNTREKIQLLLKHDKKIEAKNWVGRTPLCVACLNGNDKAVKVLLENYANPHAMDWFGRTALHFSCEGKHETNLQIIQLLLEHNANIEAENWVGWTPLLEASHHGNDKAVKVLLENYANPHAMDWFGRTALHFSCEGKHETNLQIIQLLLKHNANIEAENWVGWTPLFVACLNGNNEVVKVLLENHANPNVTDRNGQTALHFSCEGKHETNRQIIQLLLKHNANIEAENWVGWTPLFVACLNGNNDVVKVLLENHANPNVTDRNGQTALHVIYSLKSETTLQIIQLLLQHNADINAADREGRTPLIVACASGNIVAVKSLLENHANPNATHQRDRTVLHLICSRKSKTILPIIQLLLKHNADIDAVDENGRTPLSEACLNGNDKAVEVLLENHANPNVPDRNGRTALHRICSSKFKITLQIIQLLLKHNADINAIDDCGQTPLFVACLMRNDKTVEVLLENHANPNVRDRNGRTAFYYIRRWNSKTTLQIVQLLLKHNADIDAVNENGRTPLSEACLHGNDKAVKGLLENHAYSNVPDRNGRTALHLTCSRKFGTTLQIIQLLLKHNADINAMDDRGRTPLSEACASENIVAVKCLLENHANPNVTDRNGQTALHLISSWGYETTLQIIQLLLKHNADIDAVDENGWTPLSEACLNGNDKAVEVLLENHANPNVPDRNGRTALHRICLGRATTTLPIIQLLLKHNVDIEAVDEKGRTPLFVACIFGKDEAVKCLLRYGANINILDKSNQSLLQCAVNKMLSSSRENSNIHMIIKMLVSQIIKLKTAGLNVNACEFITINGVEYPTIDRLKSNAVLDDTLDTLDIECEEEIEQMKMENIGINDMFFYNLLTQHIHLLGILMENEKIQEILKPSIYDEKFPLYIGIIRFRLRDAQIRYRRYRLKKSAREYFSLNINQELPHECIDAVLDYLTVVDLETFIRTFEPSRKSTTFKRVLHSFLDFVQFKFLKN